MFKKIRLFNKLCKIIEAVEAFYDGNKKKIEKVKDFIPEIEEYIKEAKRIIKEHKDKIIK